MENKTLEELYSDIYVRQASLSRCPNEHIRNPLDLECYHIDSEMGKFIRTMLYNLDKKKILVFNDRVCTVNSKDVIRE